MRKHTGNIVGALVLIGLGLWFLAQNLNVPLPGIGAIWPVFLVLGGLVALIDYAAGGRRDSGDVFAGVLALLLGVFFFVFTLGLSLPLPGLQEGVDWSDMSRLWPVILLAVGLALLAKFAISPRRDWGELTIGVLAILVGSVALFFTLGFGPGGLGMSLFKLWPLILILIGLVALLRVVLGRGR